VEPTKPMTVDNRDLNAHDRTVRLGPAMGIRADNLNLLTRRRVVLELDSSSASSLAGKMAFLTVVNLAARLGPYAPHLEIRVPSDVEPVQSGTYPACATLAEQAFWMLVNATSMDRFIRTSEPGAGLADVVVAIGEPETDGREIIRVGWGNWFGEVTTGKENLLRPTTSNPFGSMIGGALAVARLHTLQARAMGASIALPPASWRLGALSFASRDADLFTGLDAPPTLLVGAGALGSAFVYALSHIPFLRAVIEVVDNDILKSPNANRQITAPFERARSATVNKVDDLASVWKAVTPIPKTYERFKADSGRSAGQFTIAVTGVDNFAARRDVASDLPKAVIDGATGGFMLALTRATDPRSSCLRCLYPEIHRDEVANWAELLGCSREVVEELQRGARTFDDDVIQTIRRDGSYDVDEEAEQGLRSIGWPYLARAPCGRGQLRGVPSGSVSYVSALCGFLMAGEYIAEVAGIPILKSPLYRWEWDHVLTVPPSLAGRVAVDPVASCLERHELRSEIYRSRWNTSSSA
jgi:hypothetical protein